MSLGFKLPHGIKNKQALIKPVVCCLECSREVRIKSNGGLYRHKMGRLQGRVWCKGSDCYNGMTDNSDKIILEVKNTCHRCNGTGTAQVDWKGDAGEVIGLSVPCRDCHGTGSIKTQAFFRANR